MFLSTILSTADLFLPSRAVSPPNYQSPDEIVRWGCGPPRYRASVLSEV